MAAIKERDRPRQGGLVRDGLRSLGRERARNPEFSGCRAMRPTYRWSCHPRQGQIINALGSEGWTMLMEDALEKLAEGQFPHIYLGSIGPQVARALGAKGTDEVLLLQYSYSHIRFEHKELRKEQMMILPDLLKNGIVIQHKKHKNKAAIFYQDPTGSDRYFAAIKATCSGNAIYCDTFRRARVRNTKSKLRNGILLRRHK